MISLFSTCKPFGVDPHVDIIQRNAILSWVDMKPAVRPMLIGDESGVRELCHETGIYHVKDVERVDGVPLVRSLWSQGMSMHMGDVFAYVNADIILLPNFYSTLEAIASTHNQFMAVGRRWNTNISTPLDFSDGRWISVVYEYIEHGSLYAECALDYFCWRGDWWGEIPEYAVGRYVWDNWLLWKPLSIGVPVIDCTESITAVHQSHAQLPWHDPVADKNRLAHKGGMCGLKDVRLEFTCGEIKNKT